MKAGSAEHLQSNVLRQRTGDHCLRQFEAYVLGAFP